MNSISNIEKYCEFIKDNPKKINKKIKVVYEKLLDDIKNPKTVKYLNKMTGEIEEVTYIFDIKKLKDLLNLSKDFANIQKADGRENP